MEKEKELLIAAIQTVQAKGWTLSDKCYYRPEIKRCCPLVAISVAEDKEETKNDLDFYERLSFARDLFKWTPIEVWAFIYGFDNKFIGGLPAGYAPEHMAFWGLGQEIRKLYPPA